MLALAVAAGALCAGCNTVDLGSPPADVNACRPGRQFFIDQIWPNVLDQDYGGKHCGDSSCHAPGNQHALLLVTPSGPGSIMGGVIVPMEWESNYESAANEMNCSNADASLLLEKPSGLQTHGGGMLFSSTGTEADLITMWVSQP